MDIDLKNTNEEVKENRITFEKQELENNRKTNQKNFLETTIGKTINTTLDIGLRMVLPDFIENQVIEIKNTLLEEGLKDGIKNSIDVAIDLGKSTMGIITGEFENISQIQSAIGKGGIIDTLSNTIDFVLDKTIKKGVLNKTVAGVIKEGKNVILDNIYKGIEQTLTEQVKSAEKLEKYIGNWKNYYKIKDFDGMEKEYKKMEKELKKLVPMEKTLKEARQIENLHSLIKNKGIDFELSDNEIELAKKLV